MQDWLFVRREKNGKTRWWLKLSSEEEVLRFWETNECFDRDREHYEKVKKYSHDDRTAVTHSEFGGVAQRYEKDLYDLSGTGIGGYDLLKADQLRTILRMLNETGAAYVNAKMGVNGENPGFRTVGFLRKKELEFPRYHDSDIRIKRFDDGKHYYAYIGDIQVRDGDVLKWDTYDEAYMQAKKYSETKIF